MRVSAGLLLALAAALLPGAHAAPGPTPAFRGQALGAALEELHRRGLNLIYSSEVVRPELVVMDEPKGTDPRGILDEILAPLGLRAQAGAQQAILIVAAPHSEPASAAADPARPSPRFIERIVVTPGHHEIVPQDVTAKRSLDSRDVLIAPTLGSDPSRVVTLLPGIAAADGSATFHVRGSATNDVALILDGLELYDPFHLSGFQSPFSVIDGRLVDSVDFLGGGFTAERGDRNGGFLEMSSSQAGDRASTEVEVGTLNSRVAYDGPSPLGPMLVSTRYWYPETVGNAVPFGADGLRPTFSDLYLKLGLVASPRAVVTAHALVASDRAKLNEADGRERVSASNGSTYLWLRGLRSWTDRVTTDTIVAAGQIGRYRHGFAEPDDVVVSVSDNRRVRFFQLRNDASWSLGGSRVLKGGVDLRRLDADLSFAGETPDSPMSVALARSGTSASAYASFRTSLSERVAAEVGMRWDRQTYTGNQQWSPRLNLVWRATDHSELRLGAGRYAQSLRIHELRIEDGETTYGPPELCRQLDVTFVHQFANRWSVRLDAYVHRFSQLQPRYENLYHPVELFPEFESDRVLVAPESGELHGAELSLHGDPTAPLSWWASYVWSSARDVIDGVEVPRSWDQTHAGTFLVARRWNSGWFVSGSGTVHTGWPTTPADGVRNSTRFPTYARVDLKTGRTIRAGKGSVRVELSIVNLTNRQNACCVDEFGPDGTASYDAWMGMTPTLQSIWHY